MLTPFLWHGSLGIRESVLLAPIRIRRLGLLPDLRVRVAEHKADVEVRMLHLDHEHLLAISRTELTLAFNDDGLLG